MSGTRRRLTDDVGLDEQGGAAAAREWDEASWETIVQRQVIAAKQVFASVNLKTGRTWGRRIRQAKIVVPNAHL